MGNMLKERGRNKGREGEREGGKRKEGKRQDKTPFDKWARNLIRRFSKEEK